jgi:CDP-2,3-bis-(O-geranylgeranyl)-sn-glycerol synthase
MMGDIIFFVAKSFYFMIPGLLANMAPVIFGCIDFLAYPVDFGRKWRGKPILGSHKTFRGFFFGILCAIIAVFIQKLLFVIPSFRAISLIDYSRINFVLLGFLVGFGVLFGDLVKSFFKRRLNIRPGKRWFPWDQIDSLIGGMVFLSIIYIPPWQVLLFIVISVPILHVLVNHIAFYLGLKDTKW